MFLLWVYLTSLTTLSLNSWPSCFRCMTTWDAQLQSSDPTSAAQRELLSLRVSSQLLQTRGKVAEKWGRAGVSDVSSSKRGCRCITSSGSGEETDEVASVRSCSRGSRWAVVGGEESSWSRWLVAPPTHAGGGEGYSNPTVIAALKLALLLGNLCHLFHVVWV